MNKEIWKQIKDYPDYQVSNLGRIKSTKFGKERILKQRVNSKGYDLCQLYDNNVIKSEQIHSLVAEYFIGKRKEGFFVNHKDGNSLNNNAENLEYISSRDNTLHFWKSKNKSSKYAGVYLDKKSKKWRAQICIKSKHLSLGYFEDETDAYNAYLKALKENDINSKYA